MKTLSIYAVLIFSILFSTTTYAQQTVKETIKVWGNCGMCKKTIEKAAKEAGAKSASWSEETHSLSVSYSNKKTSSAKIQESIARTGYDTQDLTADSKAYDNLHGCCQYERKASDAANTNTKVCCDHAGCGGEAGICKEMAGCKDTACCKM